MRLEEIHNLWELDSQIDILNLQNSAQVGPKLHSKYWKILSYERIRHRMMSDELEALKHAKFWFFLHGPDEETQSKGWELPPRGKVIIKDEANKMVEVDKEVVEKTMRVFVQKEKILLLESIINSINSRSYTIRNIIDYMKFKAGN